MRKWMGLFFGENYLLRCQGRLSILNWTVTHTDFIAKNASENSVNFFFPDVALYPYKRTIRPYMEYCCHGWAGAPCSHLDILGKLQKQVCRTVGPTLAVSLEPLGYRRNVVS